MRLHTSLAFVVALAAACSDEETETAPPPSACLEPNRAVGDRCLEPGVQDDGCPAGTLGLENGSCQPAGVPPESCGEGFEHDGEAACEPILPAEPCPVGEMAIPGESACHVVMPCGAGQWGDIPVDGTTVYVDAAYAGVDSDGSSAKPFITVSDAVAAAAPDSLIAVAAGSYVEDVDIYGKAVRLWGKCPSEVEILGTGASVAGLVVREGASGTEVHGLALGGASVGLGISGAESVLIDKVWIHDASSRAVTVENTLGPTSVTLRDALIEDNRDHGVFVAGAEVTLEGLVVRRTRPRLGDQLNGRGIAIQLVCTPAGCIPAQRSTAVVRRALVEENHESGIFVMGSDATLESLVVRRTLPRASDQLSGRGIVVQLACMPEGCDATARSNAVVRSALLEENHDLGVLVMGSDATLEGLVVRRTLPREGDQLGGRGIGVMLSCHGGNCDTAARSTALVRGALVEQNHDIGALVMGSDATLEGLLVRHTLPQMTDGYFGRGISAQLACFAGVCNPAARASAIVRGSRIEDNHGFGVSVGGADATLEGVLVADTLLEQATAVLGDGISVFSYDATATAKVTSSLIETNPRAGLSSFGATISLGASALRCNGFDLAGDDFFGETFTFEALGANACGCPDAVNACKAQSVGLEPPAPLAAE